jgi:coiled-coil domain-containing protein 130
VSDAYGADPYAHSRRLRKRFRTEKKAEQARAAVDTELKDRYALPSDLNLVREDETSLGAARTEWREAQEAKRASEISSRGSDLRAPRMKGLAATVRTPTTSTPLDSLKARILDNTARRGSAARAAGGMFSKR